VEEVLVEARSRDIQLDDGDYFKIIIALCQNKMAAQAQVREIGVETYVTY
jgi:hypothetical protein